MGRQTVRIRVTRRTVKTNNSNQSNQRTCPVCNGTGKVSR